MRRSDERVNAHEIVIPEEAPVFYTNATMIVSNQDEFVLDFLTILPGDHVMPVQARAILAPTHVKRLISMLSAQLDKYEEDYGEVRNTPNQRDENKLPHSKSKKDDEFHRGIDDVIG